MSWMDRVEISRRYHNSSRHKNNNNKNKNKTLSDTDTKDALPDDMLVHQLLPHVSICELIVIGVFLLVYCLLY